MSTDVIVCPSLPSNSLENEKPPLQDKIVSNLMELLSWRILFAFTCTLVEHISPWPC